METPSATPDSSSRARVCFGSWLLVLLVLLFAGCVRIRLLDLPLERDEGEYAYAGQLILQGIPPYELAWNMKLPGTYLAYALGMALFGQTTSGVHLTLLLVNSLTIVFVFLLGRKLFGNLAGIVACASYAVMTLSPAVAGLAAHANHFVVLFAVPGILLLLRAVETGAGKLFFGSGLLLGLSFLMKQQGACFGLFGAGYLAWTGWQKRELLSKPSARKILGFGAGLALPFALTCLWLAFAGVFGRFWFWTVVYARIYETAMPLATGIQGCLVEHLRQTRDLSAGFWLLTLAGMIAAGSQRAFRRPLAFAVALWCFSFLGTAAGFYFRGHYFILLLPAFALLTGMAVAALRSAWRFTWLADVFKSLPVIAFGLVLAWAIYDQAQPLFQWPPAEASRNLYPRNPFVEAVAVGNHLRENSPVRATVAVMGSEPEIYFYARRHSATGYIYTYALMESQPHALEMQRDMVREIETNRPDFLVQVQAQLSWLPNPDSPRYLSDWFESYARDHYDKIGVVGFGAGGKLASLWDGTNLDSVSLSEPLVVFRRKPD